MSRLFLIIGITSMYIGTVSSVLIGWYLSLDGYSLVHAVFAGTLIASCSLAIGATIIGMIIGYSDQNLEKLISQKMPKQKPAPMTGTLGTHDGRVLKVEFTKDSSDSGFIEEIEPL